MHHSTVKHAKHVEQEHVKKITLFLFFWVTRIPHLEVFQAIVLPVSYLILNETLFICADKAVLMQRQYSCRCLLFTKDSLKET